MNRRHILLSGVAVVALAGCTTAGPNPVPLWVAGIQAVAQEFTNDLPAILQAAGASGSGASIQSIIDKIVAAASAISSASTQVQGQSVLQQIEGYVNSLAPLVAPFAASVPGLGIVIAALPAIELGLNVLTSFLSPQAKALGATVAPTARRGVAIGYLSPQEALVILLQRTGK